MVTLISKLVSIVRRRPSTDRAIAGITKALDHLDAVVAHEDARLVKLEDKMTNLCKDQIATSERRNRAKKVAAKFTELVSA